LQKKELCKEGSNFLGPLFADAKLKFRLFEIMSGYLHCMQLLLMRSVALGGITRGEILNKRHAVQREQLRKDYINLPAPLFAKMAYLAP
jgi:hypothetical protein